MLNNENINKIIINKAANNRIKNNFLGLTIFITYDIIINQTECVCLNSPRSEWFILRQSQPAQSSGEQTCWKHWKHKTKRRILRIYQNEYPFLWAITPPKNIRLIHCQRIDQRVQPRYLIAPFEAAFNPDDLGTPRQLSFWFVWGNETTPGIPAFIQKLDSLAPAICEGKSLRRSQTKDEAERKISQYLHQLTQSCLLYIIEAIEFFPPHPPEWWLAVVKPPKEGDLRQWLMTHLEC